MISFVVLVHSALHYIRPEAEAEAPDTKAKAATASADEKKPADEQQQQQQQDATTQKTQQRPTRADETATAKGVPVVRSMETTTDETEDMTIQIPEALRVDVRMETMTAQEISVVAIQPAETTTAQGVSVVDVRLLPHPEEPIFQIPEALRVADENRSARQIQPEPPVVQPLSVSSVGAEESIERRVATAVVNSMSVDKFTDEELMALIGKAACLLKKEYAFVRLNAPCTIFGDIHGNLPDFLKFFSMPKTLIGPQVLRLEPPNKNLLFLGDYVDRGKFSLEVIAFLLSLKLLFPDKVTLLRGNHEITETNTKYGFRKEIIKKRSGDPNNLYKEFNDLFTHLPLCALVSGAILCMHGGLPRPMPTWAELSELRKPATDDEIFNSDKLIVCDLVWADPTNTNEPLELLSADRSEAWDEEPDRVLIAAGHKLSNVRYNQERGVSIQFNDEYIREFMINHPHIRGIVRAHEHCSAGHRFNESATLCTLFSSPRYEDEEPPPRGSAMEVSANLSQIRIITLVPKTEEHRDCATGKK